MQTNLNESTLESSGKAFDFLGSSGVLLFSSVWAVEIKVSPHQREEAMDSNFALIRIHQQCTSANLTAHDRFRSPWDSPGQLLGRRSMGLAHQSHRSSVNTFACSDVKIQMRPTGVDGVVVTRSPRMSDVPGSDPGTATGYALLMSSNKSETRVQCFPSPE
ncbi:hypothetical protein CLF_106818 [Clonorchis sinensis]|uniref:Uncharacterized protein n=1 Tax=Clonorchis sinensis TaxID=79923 RepID=G7YFS2_CLOSI|nr:hypothetical protein CLF_106818 [Clonorchis sinensis]